MGLFSKYLDILNEVEISDEEEYLGFHGASFSDIGDLSLHKNRGGKSDKAWKKIIDKQAEKDQDLIIRRGKLRDEYNKKVESGEIKKPSSLLSTRRIAQGHEDNLSVQAARRILTRKGYDWTKPLEVKE